MRLSRSVAWGWFVLGCVAALGVQGRAAESGVAPARFDRLSRGINVGWLNNKGFVLNRETAEKEARFIKATGCRHLRLYLNVDGLRDAAVRDQPDARKLPALDAAIEIALQQDLAVIVDTFHYGTNGLLKFPGPGDTEAAVMVRFWAVLARHLARHDPERVFLEVANEPSLENPLDWYEVETRILAAMRENAPRHTLIAGYNLRSARNEWNGIKALTLFPVVADRNVVYNFHYYNPMTLTHQGAPWVKSAASKLQGVPYPAGPDTVGPVIAQTADASAKKMLERYGSEQWNRERIFRELKVAADWAEQHHLRVTCNEFGVYRNVAPPAARAAWTRDVRESLEKLGIGWTIWNSSFGFLQREGGELKADPGILSALGLK